MPRTPSKGAPRRQGVSFQACQSPLHLLLFFMFSPSPPHTLAAGLQGVPVATKPGHAPLLHHCSFCITISPVKAPPNPSFTLGPLLLHPCLPPHGLSTGVPDTGSQWAATPHPGLI
jgi:hypothetical protein